MTIESIKSKAIAAFAYSLLAYALSLVSLSTFIVFVSGLCPHFSVNALSKGESLGYALTVNTGLLLLFGLQHSVMARKRFKHWLIRYIPESTERATYCLGSSLALVALPLFWVPMNGTVWDVSASSVTWLVAGIGTLGWGLLLVATFQLDHFELFGLRQPYSRLVGKPMPEARFKTPGLYKVVRHPIQLGVLIGMWAVPASSVNHLVVAGGMTVYILIGLYFEEKDLIAQFGRHYRDYKQQVAKLIPFVG